jgi:hypothetical protein
MSLGVWALHEAPSFRSPLVPRFILHRPGEQRERVGVIPDYRLDQLDARACCARWRQLYLERRDEI